MAGDGDDRLIQTWGVLISTFLPPWLYPNKEEDNRTRKREAGEWLQGRLGITVSAADVTSSTTTTSLSLAEGGCSDLSPLLVNVEEGKSGMGIRVGKTRIWAGQERGIAGENWWPVCSLYG